MDTIHNENLKADCNSKHSVLRSMDDFVKQQTGMDFVTVEKEKLGALWVLPDDIICMCLVHFATMKEYYTSLKRLSKWIEVESTSQ